VREHVAGDLVYAVGKGPKAFRRGVEQIEEIEDDIPPSLFVRAVRGNIISYQIVYRIIPYQ
jgi:hypothetical protein